MSGTPAGIDLFDPATQEDWYPTYQLLRDEAPVYRIPETDIYVLSRYSDLAFVNRRTDLFANGPGATAAYINDPEALRIYREEGMARRSVLGTEPPVHRRYRNLVDPFFSEGAAERRRPLIEGIVNDLIDSWIADAQVEFVGQFALPLPVTVITALLGFDLADVPLLKAWSEAWVIPFAGPMSPEQQRFVARQGVEFQHHILATLAAKRDQPDDSVISHLAHTVFDDEGTLRPLSETEIVNIVDHLYIGGNETTTFALASGLWLLQRHPDVEARLRAEPGLIPAFVEETLRLESPTQGLPRHAKLDVEIGGVTIPAGATVHLRFAAANRDERYFAEPDKLDLDRANANRHVAFGQGEHHCPGAGLSRVEQRIAWASLLTRLSAWAPAPDAPPVDHHPGFVLRAIKELPITFTAAG